MSSLWKSRNIELPRDNLLLDRFYNELMIPNFPIKEELEPLEVWKNKLAEKSLPKPKSRSQLHILLALENKEETSGILGGIVFEYFVHSNVVLITYLVISNKVRGQGAGLFITLEAWKTMKSISNLNASANNNNKSGDVGPSAIFCEVNDPMRIEDSQDAHSPLERIKAFQTMGVRTLGNGFPYVQPALKEGSERGRDMLLSVVVGPMTPRDDKGELYISGEVVKNFILDFWMDYLEKPQEDSDVKKMVAFAESHPEIKLVDFDLTRFKTSSKDKKNSVAPSSLPDIKCRIDRHIIIIGAGLAGLAAARQLIADGFKVTVIEARTRLGGRVYTSRSFGTRVDFGASWLHGMEGSALADFALKEIPNLRLSKSEDENATLYDATGKPIPQEILFESFVKNTNLLESLHNSLVSEYGEKNPCPISLSSAFESFYQRQAPSEKYASSLHKQSQNFLLSGIESLQAASLHELSAKDFAQGSHYEGGDQLVPDGFFQIILKLASNVPVIRGRSVTKIVTKNNDPVHSFNSNGVKVHFSDKSIPPLEGDAVLVTVPIGVLQKKVIEFIPSLPKWKLESIDQIGAGISNRIILRFEKVFWPPSDFLSYNSVLPKSSTGKNQDLSKDENLDFGLRARESIFFFNHSKASGEGDTAPILIAIVNGDVARYFETISDKAVVELLVLRLQKMFSNIQLPKVVESHVTRWGAYPTSYCAYSFCKVGCSPSAFDTAGSPVDNKIFFAGEHTSATRFGYADGAYDTGLREADRIRKVFVDGIRISSNL